MPQLDVLLLFLAVGFGSFTWVALFIVSRATHQTRLTILSCVAMLSVAVFFLQSVLIEYLTNKSDTIPFLSRYFWWSNVLPVALWFHLSNSIVNRYKKSPLITPTVAVAYSVSLVVIVLGMFSNAILDYSKSPSLVLGGDVYWLFTLFLVVTMSGAVVNIARSLMALRDKLQSASSALALHLWMVLIGAGLFLVGGIWLAIRIQFNMLALPREPGYAVLVLGLALYGYAVAHYDMLLEGKNVQRDFIYSFTGILFINLLYVIGLAITQTLTPFNLLMVVGLATITHTVVDWGRSLLDKFFFSEAEQLARSDARAYATALASQPAEQPELSELVASPPGATYAETEHTIPINSDASVAPSILATPPTTLPLENNSIPEADEPLNQEKAFKDAVRKAITGLKSPPQLIKSPLLSLKIVERQLEENGLEDDNRLNRAAALKSLLIDMIERLRPTDSEAGGTTDAWRFYNVLYYPYVREISKKQALSEARRLNDERRRQGQREVGDTEKVLLWLSDVDEDTFYKWQRRASDTIAAILREEEAILRGNNPAKVATLR